MPNRPQFEQVLERIGSGRLAPRKDEIASILRGVTALRAGMPVEISLPTQGEKRAPNGRDYHVKMRASTGNVARDAGIIPMSAWRDGGIARFNENPVILAYHDHKQPIGVSVHTEISKKEKALVEYWLFHEESETSRMMKKLYEKGFMRASSVGFLVHDFELVDEAKEKELQDELGTRDPIYWIATRAELLETSAVPVPADPYALAIEHAIENGRASGIDVKSLIGWSRGDFPKETPVAEKTEAEKAVIAAAEAAEVERKKQELSGTPAPADSSKEVEALNARIVVLEAANKELRGLLESFEERVAKVETRGITPEAEVTTEGDEARAEQLVEIEKLAGETDEQAINRFLDAAVAKTTGAPVAK